MYLFMACLLAPHLMASRFAERAWSTLQGSTSTRCYLLPYMLVSVTENANTADHCCYSCACPAKPPVCPLGKYLRLKRIHFQLPYDVMWLWQHNQVQLWPFDTERRKSSKHEFVECYKYTWM